MKMIQKPLAIFFTGFLMVGIAGCEKEKGPAEKMGKKMDQTVEKIEKKYDEAKDALLDKEPGPAEKVGKSIDDAAKRIVEKYEEPKTDAEEKLNKEEAQEAK
jgi:hypothetical protein